MTDSDFKGFLSAVKKRGKNVKGEDLWRFHFDNCEITVSRKTNRARTYRVVFWEYCPELDMYVVSGSVGKNVKGTENIELPEVLKCLKLAKSYKGETNVYE